MTKIDWKWDLSIGQVITVVSVVFTIGAGWSTVNARVDAHEHRLNALTKQADELKSSDDARRLEDTRERVAIARALTELQTDVRLLRQAFERRTLAPAP